MVLGRNKLFFSASLASFTKDILGLNCNQIVNPPEGIFQDAISLKCSVNSSHKQSSLCL